jgi:hypothetical protein
MLRLQESAWFVIFQKRKKKDGLSSHGPDPFDYLRLLWFPLQSGSLLAFLKAKTHESPFIT